MEISLVQGILLALVACVIGLDYWLEALFIFRPLIVSTITGIILGDVKLGLTTGALCELTFAGLTPAGGTQPPNPVLAGFMITVIAYTTRVDATAALGLALPFSILMQQVILFFYSSFSFFMAKADRYAETGDTAGLGKLNILMSGIVTLSYGLIVFLCTYVAQSGMQTLVESMPVFLTHGLEVAGGLLPAVGFGMLLRVMMKAKYAPYLIAGFLMATFISIPNLLPVALLGIAFAVYDFYGAKTRQEELAAASQSIGGNTHGGI